VQQGVGCNNKKRFKPVPKAKKIVYDRNKQLVYDKGIIAKAEFENIVLIIRLSARLLLV
jgi:hypothetical protein